MTVAESLDVTKIYSVRGLLPPETPLLRERPFRAPHHTTSYVGLVGGGSWPRPGEISLAHRGVLFLDELPEFGATKLEGLRQPLEDRTVTLARAAGTLSFPANFTDMGPKAAPTAPSTTPLRHYCPAVRQMGLSARAYHRGVEAGADHRRSGPEDRSAAARRDPAVPTRVAEAKRVAGNARMGRRRACRSTQLPRTGSLWPSEGTHKRLDEVVVRRQLIVVDGWPGRCVVQRVNDAVSGCPADVEELDHGGRRFRRRICAAPGPTRDDQINISMQGSLSLLVSRLDEDVATSPG